MSRTEMLSVGLSKNVGGDWWRWPRVQAWRGTKARGVFLRVGWRSTAYGVHVVRRTRFHPSDES